MINEKIEKSFLLIISPAFIFEDWQITQLLNVPKYIIANIYSYINKINKICKINLSMIIYVISIEYLKV